MQHAALAEQFDDVSRGLRAGGHGIIIRKARALLEGGDIDGAAAFIERAGAGMHDKTLQGLVTALRAWAEAGGDVAALTAEGAWTASRAREDRAASLIAEAVSGGDDLGGLTDALALERMALDEKEPLPELPPMPERTSAAPEAPVEPETPVEPEAPVDAAEPEAPVDAAEPEAPADAAEPVEPEAPPAAVEKPSTLEARDPDFDGAAEPEAPAEPETPAEPEAPVDAVEPETPAEPEEPAADEPAEPETPAEPESFGADAADSTPEPAKPTTPATTEEGGGALWIILAIAAIAAGAYFYFFR